jgi:hypothetical protein
VLPNEKRQKEQANKKDDRMEDQLDQKDQHHNKIEESFHTVILDKSADVAFRRLGGAI